MSFVPLAASNCGFSKHLETIEISFFAFSLAALAVAPIAVSHVFFGSLLCRMLIFVGSFLPARLLLEDEATQLTEAKTCRSRSPTEVRK